MNAVFARAMAAVFGGYAFTYAFTACLARLLPLERIDALLDESYKALNGADYELGSLLDSSSQLASELNGVGAQARSLVVDSAPLLDGQLQSADDVRTWARSLAGVSQTSSYNICRRRDSSPQSGSRLPARCKSARSQAQRHYRHLRPCR